MFKADPSTCLRAPGANHLDDGSNRDTNNADLCDYYELCLLFSYGVGFMYICIISYDCGST